jgi:Xaa-Pro aminopeptidase
MSEQLIKVRELMSLRGWNIYLLPRTDEHQSEYIGPSDERVKFISGFSGSNAFAVISLSEALLWTDSRYFLQAEKELQEGWALRKLVEEEKKWFEHVVDNYPAATKIGVDPRLLTARIYASTQRPATIGLNC